MSKQSGRKDEVEAIATALASDPRALEAYSSASPAHLLDLLARACAACRADVSVFASSALLALARRGALPHEHWETALSVCTAPNCAEAARSQCARALAAAAAGMDNVVNLVIDNHPQWFVVAPTALNLVQGPRNYYGFLKKFEEGDYLREGGSLIKLAGDTDQPYETVPESDPRPKHVHLKYKLDLAEKGRTWRILTPAPATVSSPKKRPRDDGGM